MEVDTSNEEINIPPEQDPNTETNEKLKDNETNVSLKPAEQPNDCANAKNQITSEIAEDDGVNSTTVGEQNSCKSAVSDSSQNSSQKRETVDPDQTDRHDTFLEPFKKPMTLGKGKSAKVPSSEISKDVHGASEQTDKNDEKKRKSSTLPSPKRDTSVPIPYTEPLWSSLLEEPYSLEVLKSGTIIETIDLSSKPFFVFGRQSNCDIQLGHPTISRHHAVLQHKAKSDTVKEDDRSTCKDAGLYIYDLGSTHGTFLNKQIIPKQRYIRLNVGHVVKFGGSTRSYIIVGPSSDAEAESEKSVTELKEEAMHKKLRKIEDEMTSGTKRMEEEEDQGVDWGLGEDADEESDMSENPFAATQNEELYLDDPKKTLRGWFEREGEELEYEVEEKSFGQFLCQVRLPVDDARGKPLVAEALVKGKKKEAVVQCAIEACRILDRMGLLRQATHESKKRKARNWEEDDFYDSDEDTFLDRTGTVERKREKRMLTAGKLKTKAETYESLIEKHQEVLKKIEGVQKVLDAERTGKMKTSGEKKSEEDEADTLDAFMSTLADKSSLDKVNFRRLKMDLTELQQEEAHLSKLIKIARPVSMPGLPIVSVIPKSTQQDETTKEVEKVTEDQSLDSSSSPSKEIPESVQKEKNMKVSETPKLRAVTSNEVATSTALARHSESENEGDSDKVEVAEKTKVGDKRKMDTPRPVEDSKMETFSEELHETHRKSETNKNTEKATSRKAQVEEDYSMWVPPDNQTGDGRTKLNEKYGY